MPLLRRLLCVALFIAAALPALPAGESPPIVSRQAWGARSANEALMKLQTPKAIVIHHTGELQKPKRTLETKLKGLEEFSRKPGKVGAKIKPEWGDVPYHFYIDASGRIGEGRSLAFAGDTNTGYDTSDKIQIVVEGEFEHEQPHAEQLASLRALVVWLASRHAIPPEKITNHSDNAQTDCPGAHLKPFLTELRRAAGGS
jgi:hypothetical protein